MGKTGPTQWQTHYDIKTFYCNDYKKIKKYLEGIDFLPIFATEIQEQIIQDINRYKNIKYKTL